MKVGADPLLRVSHEGLLPTRQPSREQYIHMLVAPFVVPGFVALHMLGLPP